MATRSKTLAQCEAAWMAGVPLKVTSDGFPIVMKPSMNCEYTVEGTQDIAYVGFPQDIEKPELVERIRAFLLTIPRLSAQELEDTAPDGVYTWILASTNGSAPEFYASRTTAMLEVGTVHYSIATAVGATHVHGAGEVWKHGGELTFNFLSGTFMDKWDLPKECPLKTMQTFLRQKLKDIFAYLFRAKSLVVRETEPTFINTRFLTLTTAELEGYVKAGFVVCIHDKANKAVCKSTKSACKKPMALEQETMKGGVPPTPRRPGTPSQFEVAKQMLTLGESMRPAPSASFVPIVPAKFEGKVKGLGGRKTRKAKGSRRRTRRRGGVKHIGEQMAEDLVGPKDPVSKSTRDRILFPLVKRLNLSYPQIRYLHEHAEEISPNLKPADLEAHLKQVFKL